MKRSAHLFFALTLSAAALFAADHKELKAFPEAETGYARYVITLPHKERSEEVRYEVELVAGKTVETDGVNQVRMATTIEPKPLKGWGYTYYEVTGNDRMMSTMMAAPENTPKISRFVGGKSTKISYNSRLPIVIYAPEGFEIQYRIWEAPEEFKPVKQK